MTTARVVACGLLAAAVSLASCSDERGGASTSSGVPVSSVELAATAVTTTSALPVTTLPVTTLPVTTPVTTPATSSAAADDGRAVVSFDDAGSVVGWSNVDDTVMGGVSSSTTSWQDRQLVFVGDLSLENNGGFTSVRSPEDPALGTSIGGARALVVDAEGDGRTYVLQLRTADESLYVARFETVDGVQQPSVLPLDAFEPVTRFLEPSPGSPPLDASTVVQLAIYLLDAQEGSFRLAVSAIAAQ